MVRKDLNVFEKFSFQKNANLSVYVLIFLLLLCARVFDIYTTYMATPDLSGESNLMVRYFRLGWMNVSFMNLALIALFFMLFWFSWSEHTKRNQNNGKRIGTHWRGSCFDARLWGIIGSRKRDATQRNYALEVGITLPIYVIITSYFQGVVNLLIHLELIVVSFIHSQFLYPVMIGGVFGIISHYFAKHLLYSKHPPPSKKPHKVMVPQKN
ncbi:MAG: hypothetical protein JSW28_07380 [Thermoplasmata archaeon]|nr:MAG: hypothetical protein JSW28_07380 [Thermoplasmata archaeon]